MAVLHKKIKSSSFPFQIAAELKNIPLVYLRKFLSQKSIHFLNEVI